MTEYKYDVSRLDMAIELACKYRGNGNITEDFIKGLEGARSLLKTEEDDLQLIQKQFENFAEVKHVDYNDKLLFNNKEGRFKNVVESMEKFYEKTKHLPIGIKVNEEWLEKQLQQQFILRDQSKVSLLLGMPVTIDNTISTFEFIYKKVN